jgi:hypothetical protein
MSELPFMQEVPVGLTRLEVWKLECYVDCVAPIDAKDPDWIAWTTWLSETVEAKGPTELEACHALALKLNLPWTL